VFLPKEQQWINENIVDKMKILLVVSNFNEENAILDTLQDIKDNATIDCDVLVIDNSSTDNSVNLIKTSGVDYLLHPVNTGGSAGVIKTAFKYAYYYNYDIYCHMDGDNQHYASELGKIVSPLLENRGVDVVTGSRYITNEGFQSTWSRRLGIYLFSWLLSRITRNEYTDITSGFRAYNRKAIELFAKKITKEIETITQLELWMHFAGLKSIDVAVRMRSRTSGKSEINFKNAIKFPISNLISLIGTLIQLRK
jgi:glycosyltransferase involved in cell wall biosynthesis